MNFVSVLLASSVFLIRQWNFPGTVRDLFYLICLIFFQPEPNFFLICSVTGAEGSTAELQRGPWRGWGGSPSSVHFLPAGHCGPEMRGSGDNRMGPCPPVSAIPGAPLGPPALALHGEWLLPGVLRAADHKHSQLDGKILSKATHAQPQVTHTDPLRGVWSGLWNLQDPALNLNSSINYLCEREQKSCSIFFPIFLLW